MKVMIGTIEAQVSDDGHAVLLPPPATVDGALALPFFQAGHSGGPATGTSALVAAPAPVPAAPIFDLDGRLGLSLIVCAVLAAIAASRWFKREQDHDTRSREWLDTTMDEAAFLRRYGGRVR